MNLIQQGIFYPRNVMRATKWFHGLSPEAREVVRGLMGTTKTHSFDLRSFGLQGLMGRFGSAISVLTDSGPRWTAFVHEAGREGINTVAQMEAVAQAAMKGDEGALGMLNRVTRRGKDAIVDYDRLSPTEKNVIARYIFFYPWIKGAARWSYRMPLEHPYQSAAIVGAGYYGHKYQQQQLGDVPGYSQFDLPIPGWHDKNGNPYVLGTQQLLTPSAPFQLGQAIYNFATGNPKEGQQLLGNLTPLLAGAIGALTGKDEMGRDMPMGVPGLLYSLYNALPEKRFVEEFNRSPEEMAKKLNPRNTLGKVGHTVLGGLSPKPFNKTVNEQINARKTKKKPVAPSYQQRYAWAMKQPDSVVPKKVRGDVRQWRRGQNMVHEGARALAKQMGLLNQDGTGSVTQLYEHDGGRQYYALRLGVLMSLRPNIPPKDAHRAFKKVWDSGNQKAIDALKRTINKYLSYSDRYDRSVETILEELGDKHGFKPTP
jgi:hypothetical protein